MDRNAAKTLDARMGLPMGGRPEKRGILPNGMHARGVLFFALAICAFLLATAAFAPRAHADELTVIEGEISEWQAVIEQSSAALDEATARMEEAEENIAKNQVRLDELAVQIPIQEKRSNAAARELYKFEQQRFGILEFLLGSDDFYSLLQNWEYVNYITDANVQEVNRLQAMKDELDELQVSLERDRATAQAEAVNAENALKAAQEARAEAQRRAEAEAARQAAEAEAARQAAEAAAAEEAARQAAAESGESGGESSGGGSSSEPVVTPTSDGADWSSDKETFVSEWGARLDAYLSGSPLSGYGRTFAEAAWNYGIDPRFSAAISCVESSKGAQCFRPHNAWGWGSASWGSWEEAINAHASGLARIYGYTVTVEGAKKYCPPNWEFWYNRVCQEMAKI